MLSLEKILSWAKVNNIDGIILGCTHFPYILDELLNNTNIPIIDPAEKCWKD